MSIPVVHDGGVLIHPRDGGERALQEAAAPCPEGGELLVYLHLANVPPCCCCHSGTTTADTTAVTVI